MVAMIRLLGAVMAPTQVRRDERGDVPGWVLITVMTAGLVTVLWAVAGDVLAQMLTDALRSVSS
jgi:hypothetical protein